MIKFLITFFGCLVMLAILLSYDSTLLIAQEHEFNGKIVYVIYKAKENYSHIYLFYVKSKKVVQLTDTGKNGWPRWSPDGLKIVFVSSGRNEHKNREIYIMDADGKNQRRLTYTEGGNASDPRWSSDGKLIYFHSAIRGSMRENILDLNSKKKPATVSSGEIQEIRPINDIKDFIKELKKKNKEELEQIIKELEQREKRLQEWFENMKGMFKFFPSPNGRYNLLYYDIGHRIMLLDIEKVTQKELKTILSASGRPSWSKDSKKIAYFNGLPPDQAMVIYDMEKDDYSEITFNKGSDVACGEPSWSRDSKHIVYSCGIIAAEEPDSWLYILDLETKQSVKLLQGSSPDWY